MEAIDTPAEVAVRTFLIADVRGYTRFTQEQGDEAAARLASTFALLTRRAVADRGGQVIELRGDEALAVFSSARQALRAAVELQTRFQEEMEGDPSLPLNVGIGLDAGEAIPVEGGFRGGALNLAARLCSLAAAGEVLITEPVAHLARKMDGLAYADRGMVQLKGFADPVRVMQVVSDAALAATTEAGAKDGEAPGPALKDLPIGGFLGALPEGLLVARDGELSRILEAVDAVQEGAGRLVLLEGEPGVGKTRLAQEITLIARNRGFLVATGRCYESRADVPFYPFLEALATIYAAAPDAIREAVPARWPYLGRLLPEESIAPPTFGGDPKEEQERLFRAVTGFLAALAESRSIALLLDDLHWVDSSSLELLQHLARHTRSDRLLLLGTYRDVEVQRQHPLGRAVRELNREHLAIEVPVRRLGLEGTAALTAATMGEAEISAEFAELLQGRTDGNPFFLQEVLRALVERGDLYRQEGRWERRAVEEIEVPKSVREAIGERLTRLSEEGQEVLYEASVLGQAFAFDDLQAMGDRSESEVERALEEAEAAGLVHATGRDGYTFNHALTQGAIYAELSPRRRRRLHLAVGEALEGLPERLRRRRAGELAWHFLQGDDPERALTYALLAGDESAAVFAQADAERHFRTAQELAHELGDAGQEAEALEKLGLALHGQGRYDEAVAALEGAVRLYRSAGDLADEARAGRWMSVSLRARGKASEGIEYLQALVRKLEDAGHTAGVATLYAALGQLYFGAGRYDESLEAAERAVKLARAETDTAALADAEVLRGTVLTMLNRHTEGLQVLETIIPVVEAGTDVYTLMRALTNVGEGCRVHGDFPRARAYTERALEVAERVGDPWGIAFQLCNLGDILGLLGECDIARRHVSRALALQRTIGFTWWAAYPPLEMGLLAVLTGEWEEATSLLEEAIELGERNTDIQVLRIATGRLARLDILQGRPAVAARRLEPLDDRFEIEEMGVTENLPVLAWAYLEMGEVERAVETAAAAVSRAREQEVNLHLAEALLSQGRVLHRQGKLDEARTALAEALELARAMPYPHLEARSLVASAELERSHGDGAATDRQLAEALAIFQRIGARRDVERAEVAATQR